MTEGGMFLTALNDIYWPLDEPTLPIQSGCGKGWAALLLSLLRLWARPVGCVPAHSPVGSGSAGRIQPGKWACPRNVMLTWQSNLCLQMDLCSLGDIMDICFTVKT